MNTKNLFDLYGEEVTYTNLTESVNLSYKAFIQPLRYKNKLYLRGNFTEIGKNKEDYYLYIGPGNVDISAVDGVLCTLSAGSTSYLVYRVEEHKIKGERIYYWAIIRPIVEAQEYELGEEDEEESEGTPG